MSHPANSVVPTQYGVTVFAQTTGPMRVTQYGVLVWVRTTEPGTPGVLMRCDIPSALDDSGTSFQSTITTRGMIPTGDITILGRIGEPTLVARSSSGVTIHVKALRDFAVQADLSIQPVDLTPLSQETHVIRKVEGLAMADIQVIQFVLGDLIPGVGKWSLDFMHIPTMKDGEA